MRQTTQFLKVLFDDGDFACFTASPKGTNVRSVFRSNGPEALEEFVCLNPLDSQKDHMPTAPYHAANLPRRADANVTVFRNFLLECDSLPVSEQLTIAKSIKLPYSTATFSGSKSVHFIISLAEPCANGDEYRAVAERIMAHVGKFLPIDRSTKNPSRLTRLAGVIRSDMGQEQTLLDARSRKTRSELNEWAGFDLFAPPPKSRKQTEIGTDFAPVYSMEILSLIAHGAPQGRRNNKAFWLCCELMRRHKQVLPEEELLDALCNFDLPWHEKCAIIRSSRGRMIAELKDETAV